jgi:hypothetical protein
MRFTIAISSLAALLPFVVSADDGVAINAFGLQGCQGFEEKYALNPNSKGNLAGTRRSFQITFAQAGCHMKFYTGLNQAPNDGSTLSFSTESQGACFGQPDGRQYRSFGFYCP